MKCSFCKAEIDKGKGLVYSTKIGQVSRFCSSKCKRNYFMGRKPRKLKWIVKSKEAKEEAKAIPKETPEKKKAAKKKAKSEEK